MNKDAVLATIIGFSIGLVVTTILLFGPTLVNSFQGIKLPQITPISPTASTGPTDTPQTLGAQNTTITIDAPQSESIATANELLVSGSAIVDSLVSISGPLDDAISTVRSDGKFAGTIALTEGKNDILVTSLTNGKSQTQTITVYYTPENF